MSDRLPACGKPTAPVPEPPDGPVFEPYGSPAGGWGALQATARAQVRGHSNVQGDRDQTPLVTIGNSMAEIRHLPIVPKEEYAIFIRVDLPQGTKIGSAFDFDVIQRDSRTSALLGGSRYCVVVNKEKPRRNVGAELLG
jgi:hypothetical protein